MDLSREILIAETRFLTKLREYFLFVFPEGKLESHGLDHHNRVWEYAKELLQYYQPVDSKHPDLRPQGLIIASFMHDIGMSIDPGPKHGTLSRQLCQKFLEENALSPSEHTDLLEAIEKHDDKEYLTSQEDKPLLQILSVADDLDAIGYTGIYRYLEIYILRAVKFELLGEMIIKNVSGRYNNLINIYGDKPGFIRKHRPRFEAITEFFHNFSNQVTRYHQGTGNPAGWCGVAELIAESVNNGNSLNELISYVSASNYDEIITQYFNCLRDEITH